MAVQVIEPVALVLTIGLKQFVTDAVGPSHYNVRNALFNVLNAYVGALARCCSHDDVNSRQ